MWLAVQGALAAGGVHPRAGAGGAARRAELEGLPADRQLLQAPPACQEPAGEGAAPLSSLWITGYLYGFRAFTVRVRHGGPIKRGARCAYEHVWLSASQQSACVPQAGRLEASVLGEARKDALQVEYALEDDLKSFGKGFTVLEKARPSRNWLCTWGEG